MHGFALQGRVTANAAAATPSAPRASRALQHAAQRRRASIEDSSSSHAAMKASVLAVAGPAPEAAIQADNLRQGWEAAAEAQTEARLGR